jgi:hypothetical protein
MELDIASLLSNISFWESWGYVALTAVLLGVVGESIKEFTHWLGPWEKKVGRLSALILVAGLAGEGITQPNTNAANATLVAIVNARAAKAELELAKLKAPLIIKNVSDVAEKLREYKNIKFWIATETGDMDRTEEQMQLSEQLINVFQMAGWTQESHLNKYSTEPMLRFGPVSDRGCLVSTQEDERSLRLLKAVIDALKAAGVDCFEYVDTNIISDSVLINVGLR